MIKIRLVENKDRTKVCDNCRAAADKLFALGTTGECTRKVVLVLCKDCYEKLSDGMKDFVSINNTVIGLY